MSYFSHFADASSIAPGRWMLQKTMKQEFAIMSSCLPDRQCTVLEIGAGYGELARIFVAAGFSNYIAVEPNLQMREGLAREGIQTRAYSIPTIGENDCTIDAILLKDVFEHLNGTSEALQFAAECRRVMRPGGILCISSPDYLHWGSDFFNSDYTHSNVTSMRRTQQLFQDSGFRTVRACYLSGFVTGHAASLLSHLTRSALFWLHSSHTRSRLYKLKLTLLRQFVIVGERTS